MQIDEVIKFFNHLIKETPGIDLTYIAMLVTGHDVVEVRSINESPLAAIERDNIHPGYTNDRTLQCIAIDVPEDALDDRNTVQLISMDGSGQAQRGSGFVTFGDDQWNGDGLTKGIGSNVQPHFMDLTS